MFIVKLFHFGRQMENSTKYCVLFLFQKFQLFIVNQEYGNQWTTKTYILSMMAYHKSKYER